MKKRGKEERMKKKEKRDKTEREWNTGKEEGC
jgi:hypothetical protein